MCVFDVKIYKHNTRLTPYIQMNLDDVVVTNIPKKQRGRPRKNGTHTVKKNRSAHKVPVIYEKEIILHLPISLKDVGTNETNKFEVAQTEKDDNNVRSILSMSDSSSSSETGQKLTYNQLIKMVEEKNEIINEFKNKFGTFRDDSSTSKEIKIHTVKIGLDEDSNGHIIVPQHTNIVCWWDTCPFDGEPYFIPERYYDGKFYVFGCFCSVNCAAAYNLNLGDYKFTDRHSLLKWMYHISPKCDIYIPPQPVPILTQFGGCVTIEEYRKNNYLCDKEYRLLMPPMVAVVSCIEETPNNKTKNINMILSDDTNKKKTKTTIGISKQSFGFTKKIKPHIV